MKKNKESVWLIILLILFAFIIRVIPFSFPEFTFEEARIAYRGYVLVKAGEDELNRSFPLLFNSLEDYQLPAVSYLAAGGQFVFGKSEFGARIPFITVSMLLVFLIYQIAKFFSQNSYFWLTSASVAAFSPVLFFLSKTPNEVVLLAFIFALVFYLLINKTSIVFIILTMIIAILTSKQAWFILLPFTFFTLSFYGKSSSNKRKFALIGLSAIIVFLAFALFSTVPQSGRSLRENNFSIFSDITIKNGIDRLRGQGMESGWSQLIDRILFNKSHFLVVGFLHWLSNINLATYFGQFDTSGRFNFSYSGALAKILIIPFIWGLVYIIRKGRAREKLLLAFFLILTFPTIFVYPNLNQSLVVLTIPFAALIISFGLVQFKGSILLFVIMLMFIELGLNLLYLKPEKKNTNFLRPHWVRELTQDIHTQSSNYKVAVSDDIVDDIVPFIQWYNSLDISPDFQNIPYPYKFRQTELKNIKIIGSQNQLYSCKDENYQKVFLSKRDKNKVGDFKVSKIYKDGLNKEVVYLLEKSLCMQ